MAVRSPQEKSAINRMLQSHGLGRLEDGNGLLAQLGYLVQDHEHMRSLLARCEPEERVNMYNALKANMRFPAKPLDVYMAETALKAELTQLPTLKPDGTYDHNPPLVPEVGEEDWNRYLGRLEEGGEACALPVAEVSPTPDMPFVRAAVQKVQDIQGAQFGVDGAFAKERLVVTCRSCTKQEVFTGDTKDDCIFQARREGWVHYINPNGIAVDICTDCPAIRKTAVVG